MSTSVSTWRRRVTRFLDRDLWLGEGAASSGPLGLARRLLQLAVLVGQQFVRDQLLLRASALTYYTILALIPLLAIVLALVQALGVHEDVAQIIVKRVAAGSPEAGEWILERVRGVDFSGLGTLGAAVLVLTTILGISSVERALNGIWGIARPRSWERRVPDYLAVLIVAPLLLGVALSLGATLRSQTVLQRLLELPGFGKAYALALRQAPTLFLTFGFAFLYWFMPNTRVKVSSALLGGVLAAVLFTLAQGAYVGFNVGLARYNALFGSLVALPLLLVWVYASWVIVLFGAEVAFAHQHLAFFRRTRQHATPSRAAQEAIALALTVRIARAFRDGEGGLDPDGLADEVDAPVRTVRELLADLEHAGIVALRAGTGRDVFQLGRSAERIHAADVLHAVRGERGLPGRLGVTSGAVSELLADADRRSDERLEAVSLADLVTRTEREA